MHTDNVSARATPPASTHATTSAGTKVLCFFLSRKKTLSSFLKTESKRPLLPALI
jgi:hypothetical protein